MMLNYQLVDVKCSQPGSAESPEADAHEGMASALLVHKP